jgi:hypothetical protein
MERYLISSSKCLPNKYMPQISQISQTKLNYLRSIFIYKTTESSFKSVQFVKSVVKMTHKQTDKLPGK